MPDHKTHVCGPWTPRDPAAAADPEFPAPDTEWVCEVCGKTLDPSVARTPCPGCGEILPFDEVLAHEACGYVAPRPN